MHDGNGNAEKTTADSKDVESAAASSGEEFFRRWKLPGAPVHYAVLAALILFVISVERALTGNTDLDVFYEAGRYFWENHTMIPESDILRYPPPFHAFTALFSWLPFSAFAIVRIIIDLLLLADLPRRIERLSGVSVWHQLPAWLVALPFLADNVWLGQHGAELLWLTTVGLMNARVGRPFAGGMILSAAMWLKVLPAGLLAIPVFLGPKRWRTIAGALAGTLAMFALFACFSGIPNTIDATRQWVGFVDSGYTPEIMVEEKRALRYNNQGLAVTLARTWGDVPHSDISGQFQLASFPLPFIWGLYRGIVVIAGLVMVATLWRCRRMGEDGKVWLGLFGMGIIGMMTLSPLIWTYYFVWLLPGAVYFSHRPKVVWSFVGVAVVGLLSVHFRSIGFHILLSLAMFGMIAWDLWRRSLRAGGDAQPA